MAEILTPSADSRRFWAVDKIILAYLAFTTILVLGWWRHLPDPARMLAWHAFGAGAILFEVKWPNRTTWVFRNWYPVIWVGACYKEMAVLIPAIRRGDADRWLAELDFRIWHANPTVWLERIQSPALTEVFQICYTLFVPAVLIVGFLLWRQRRYADFQYYAFLIVLGFLASYVGYLMVPARGPRFLLRNLQHIPLQGLWLFQGMQATLDRLESAHYDCFPSGHTELTMLAAWGSRLLGNRLFAVYFSYTLTIIFATVYLRYHYSVDVLAGAVLAAALIWFAPVLYRKLSKGGSSFGRHTDRSGR